MPNFESPITHRKFAAQPMKDLEIPDESGAQQPPNPPSNPQSFAPSVAHRYGTPMTEQEIREFQQRMEATANPDLNLSELERDVKRARQEKLHGQTRLNEGAKKRIDMLIGITRGTRSVEIEGHAYGFKTLKSREMKEALIECSQFDGTVHFPFEMRRQLLARSLTQVAGVEISQFVGSVQLEDKLALIDDMDDILLNRLYDEYLVMVKETRQRYTIKAETEAKEVVDDLKK